MNSKESPINEDPVILRLLEKMPKRVAESFNEEQLSHLKNAVGAREWGNHKVDIRGTVKFFKWRYYYVILCGRNRRSLSDQEIKVASIISALAFSFLFGVIILLVLVMMYILKSALGIDLFDEWSLGLWDLLKSK